MLVAERDRFTIAQIGFDPWHAGTLIDLLKAEDGFGDQQVIEVPQTFKGMSDASLRFEAAVVDGKVDAQGSPLFAWCASNAVVQRDGKDNIQPIKKKSRGRIDPVVAAVIGMSLAIRTAQPTESIYATRGLRMLGDVDATPTHEEEPDAE